MERWPEYILFALAVISTILLTCWTGVFELPAPMDPIPEGSDDEWKLFALMCLDAFCVIVAFIFYNKNNK